MKSATGGSKSTVTNCDWELLPATFETVNVTSYVPAVAYACFGFCTAEVVPSPKSHSQAVGPRVEASVNSAVSPPVTTVNAAPGCLATCTVAVNGVEIPASLEAIRVTVYVPASSYVLTGFWAAEAVPSPKSHSQLVGSFELISVNDATNSSTVRVKAAIGGSTTTIVLVTESEPPALLATSVTSYVPGLE